MEVKWQYAIFSKTSKTHDSTDNFLRRNMNDKQCSNFFGGFPHSSSFKLRVEKFKTRLKLHKKKSSLVLFFFKRIWVASYKFGAKWKKSWSHENARMIFTSIEKGNVNLFHLSSRVRSVVYFSCGISMFPFFGFLFLVLVYSFSVSTT